DDEIIGIGVAGHGRHLVSPFFCAYSTKRRPIRQIGRRREAEAMMPKGYILAEVEVTDPALFETYRPLAAAAIAAFGGKYLVRGGATETLEGSGTPARMVLLEFPTTERAMEWYKSAQYQEALAIRAKAATTKLVLLTGHDG
ncbi:MAG TPA: DUF1330 domain-containing protein, partial [Acidisoma sp.]|nr:DUF1330 domain-containing protein [Acidisoma sp.]